MTNMKRLIALAAIATIAFGTGTADAAREPKPSPPPTGPVVLVDQMGGMEAVPGWDPLSQHKPDGTEIQSAADDFTVPVGRTWTLTKVEVGGSRITQSTSSGLLNETPGFDVTVFKADGAGGVPGTQVATVRATPTSTSCCNNADGQLLALPEITVGSGAYWISVAYVHDPLIDGGKWYWRGYNSQNGSVARYRTPNSNGWQTLTYPHDLELRLTGTSS